MINIENLKKNIDYISKIVEVIGVLTILFGIVFSLIKYLVYVRKPEAFSYIQLRQALGKSILLGLEILIAADIMATIVTEPTLKSVTILGLIVFIRTILSFSSWEYLDIKMPSKYKTYFV